MLLGDPGLRRRACAGSRRPGLERRTQRPGENGPSGGCARRGVTPSLDPFDAAAGTPSPRPNPSARISRGSLLSETSLRIAPRSAVAIADTDLLRAARTQPVPEDRPASSLVERLRLRLVPRAQRS